MELYAYVHQTPPPKDVAATSETLAYLEACNKLFEQGFLSHDRIRNMDSQILRNIHQGYSYFSNWLDSILEKGEYKQCSLSFLVFIQLHRSEFPAHQCDSKIVFILAKYVKP